MKKKFTITLENAFETYWAHVAPGPVAANQLHETRKAFYAGAISILEVCRRISEDDISEDTGVEVLARLYAEGRAFVELVSAPTTTPN